MKKAILVATIIFALPAPAWGHNAVPNSGHLDDRQQHRVIRVSHMVFKRPAMAHLAQRYAYCESELRWWLRGSYWGMFQFDKDARRGYGGYWRKNWTITEQMRSFKRLYRARGPQPWPNCP